MNLVASDAFLIDIQEFEVQQTCVYSVLGDMFHQK